MTDVSLDKDGGRSTLVFVRVLRHEPKVVWAALTEPDQLVKWSPFTVDRSLASVGDATLTMIDEDARTELPGVVRRADAPKVLEYTWGDDVLLWQLDPDGGGTRLTLRHTVADPEDGPKVAAGWHLCVDVLEQVLDGKEVEPIVGEDAMNHGWQELYEEYLAKLG